MMKRFLAVAAILSIIAVYLPSITLSAAGEDTLNFCGINLSLEKGAYNEEQDKYEFQPQKGAWSSSGGVSYNGESSYIMSTNCDEGKIDDDDGIIEENEPQYNDTMYAVGFTMPDSGAFKFKASVSGENRDDYLKVVINGKEVYNTREIRNTTWMVTPWIEVGMLAKKGDKVHICYYKDSYNAFYHDRAYVAKLELEKFVLSSEIADTEWYSETKKEFEIKTKEELCGFSALVNEGVDFKDCTVKLANDIDMSGMIWVPAGQYNIDQYRILFGLEPDDSKTTPPGLNAYFAGTFDGQGKTIANLKCKYAYPDTTYIGFISMNYGVVKNLEMKNPIIGDGTKAKSAGAVAGFNGGTISKCAVTGGKIDIAWDKYYMAYAGGLVGSNGYCFLDSYMTILNKEGGLIENCCSSADVQVKFTQGYRGVTMAANNEAINLSAAGGLLGATYGGKVKDCYTTGNVHAISVSTRSMLKKAAAADTFAISGGFIGMVLSAIPEVYYRMDAEEEKEPVIAELENCYSTGKATAQGITIKPTEVDYAGVEEPVAVVCVTSGFLGFARNMTPDLEPDDGEEVPETYLLTAKSCYFDTEASGNNFGFKNNASFSGIEGIVTAKMKSVESYKNWDFKKTWKQYDEINHAYPVLAGVGIGNVYTVTFVDHDGTVLKTQHVTKGGAAAAPANPVREGYVFIKWDQKFDAVTGNITVKACYNTLAIEKDKVSVEGVDGTDFNPDTILVADMVTDTISQDQKKKINISISGISNGQELVDLFDIKLLLNDQPIQPDGKIKIRIKLTEQQKGYSDLKIVYINNEGKATIIPSTIEDGYVVFITDHLSYYGIIGTEIPNTGETGSASMVLLLVVSAAGLAVSYTRKRTKI